MRLARQVPLIRRVLPVLQFLLAGASLSFAGGVVTTADEESLRAALSGGGDVTFACDGVIKLTSTLAITNNTLLDGLDRQVTISGNDAVRVFQVGPGTRLTLQNLTVAKGRTNEGAGLYSLGEAVVISNCTFTGNQAVGASPAWPSDFHSVTNTYVPPGEDGAGGALYIASGALTLLHSSFLANGAQGGRGSDSPTPDTRYPSADGGSARGGAIVARGVVRMTNCVFEANSSVGGDGGNGYLGGHGGFSSGGALHNENGSISGSDCSFVANRAAGGFDGSYGRFGYRGDAYGGAIYNTGGFDFVRARWQSNNVTGTKACGGALAHMGGRATVRNGTLAQNAASGDKAGRYYPAIGGPGQGGAVYSEAEAALVECLLASNCATGGSGNDGIHEIPASGGRGLGGAIFSSGPLDIHRCALTRNRAAGGIGAFRFYPQFYNEPGGEGFGGGIYATGGSVTAINSTVCTNEAVGGQGGSTEPGKGPITGGTGGPGAGGAIYTADTILALTNCTVAANAALGGSGGLDGTATPASGPSGTASTGGLFHAGTGSLLLQNSIAAGNQAGDVAGPYTGSWNLIGSDPRLGQLADNGGPTPTMALLPDSPALDAGLSVPGVWEDQRGVPRPFGSAPDIGAYEWNGGDSSAKFTLSLMGLEQNGVRVRVNGPPEAAFQFQTSTDLVHWLELGTHQTGSNGLSELRLNAGPGESMRFYKACPGR